MINLIGWHLLVKNANNEKFEYFQPAAFFFHPCFSEKKETAHLQLHLPCLDNDLFENNIEIVLEPIKPNQNTGFLYL